MSEFRSGVLGDTKYCIEQCPLKFYSLCILFVRIRMHAGDWSIYLKRRV